MNKNGVKKPETKANSAPASKPEVKPAAKDVKKK